MVHCLLFVPNIIGYLRVACMVASFSYCFDQPIYSACLYLLGQGMDAIDGVCARYFNQCSKFGAVLDMLCDRMGLAAQLVVLSHLYKDHWGLYTFLLVLDISSHWFQMYSTLSKGATTHKGSDNALLNFYYTFPYALLIFCCGAEMMVVILYLLAFTEQKDMPQYDVLIKYKPLLMNIYYVCGPIFVAKHFMSVVQLYVSAMETIRVEFGAEGVKSVVNTQSTPKKDSKATPKTTKRATRSSSRKKRGSSRKKKLP